VSALRAWVVVSRPVNHLGWVVLLWVSTSLAVHAGSVDPLRFCVLIVIGVSAQCAMRYLNDPFDYRRGIDRPGQLKPYHAVSQGLDLVAVERVGLVCLAIAGALCVWMVVVVSPWLLLVVAAGGVTLYTYAGGPRPFSSMALSEVAELLWFGLIPTVMATAVLANRVDAGAFVAGTAVGCISATFNLANNARDVETDREAGKTTLPQLVGPAATKALFTLLLAVAFTLGPVLALVDRDPYVLLTLLALPLTVRPRRRFAQARTMAEFAPIYAELRGLELAYGLLLGLGLILQRLL
jgi:1,4-dihydroxy-2-naphthoate octaprenyltransferase